MIHNSLEALNLAIEEEFKKRECQTEHATIRISISTSRASNGIRHCSVNVECGAGCGWLIETYGNEAEALENHAKAIQTKLSDPIRGISLQELKVRILPDLASKLILNNSSRSIIGSQFAGPFQS
jgi:hypothetical protein